MAAKATKPYLTIEETAATLRVSERTVRRWIARGIVTARKLGGTVRVSREALTDAAAPSGRPRRGRPPKARANPIAVLSDESFAKTWDNPADAVYDRWRQIYGIRKR